METFDFAFLTTKSHKITMQIKTVARQALIQLPLGTDWNLAESR